MHTKFTYIISLLVLAGALQAVALPDTKGRRKEELGASRELANVDQASKRQKSSNSNSADNKQQQQPQQSLDTQSTTPLLDTSNGSNSNSRPSIVVPSETIVEDKRARLPNEKKMDQLMSLLLAELPTLDIASLSGSSGDTSKRPEVANSHPVSEGLKARSAHQQFVYIDNSAYRNEKYTPCFFNAITCFPWIRTRHARSAS